MQKTVVINVVGLTKSLLAFESPNLKSFLREGASRSIETLIPAVTCSVQSTYLTGLPPGAHGILGNGWYERSLNQHLFWHQSNQLVQGEKVWEVAKRRDPAFTCANLFWWFNMYSSVDVAVTPRPIYAADGRKIPDLWTNPPALRDLLQAELGRFPLFNFWGPTASLPSSEWIRDASFLVEKNFHPTLTLIYLPHLDYDLQRFGPQSAEAQQALLDIDKICGELIHFYREVGAKIVLLSEYGIQPVNKAVAINRVLREAGYLSVRTELGGEILDCGASEAFALCDHQLAQIYIRSSKNVLPIKKLLSSVRGIAAVLDTEAQRERNILHARSGELLCLSEADAWFSYYYWLEDSCAPDFARTVDIHRKPGYDPLELFFDPKLSMPRLRMAKTLLLKKLGFRSLFRVVGFDESLIRGSHGVAPGRLEDGPILITSEPSFFDRDVRESMRPEEVRDLILSHLFSSA